MSKLRYIPKEFNPNGKPRVYFACHPADQERFLETTAKDLQSAHTCVVWYLPADEAADEEFWTDLQQMQLFVMPVTRRLLDESNRAMDQEFPFALEHHIPVLPLLMEPSALKGYPDKFGDLQFLNPLDLDPTAIPYETKLKNYLSSVLIGDELRKKIQAAFDAYVFLSYRKKDRHYAQKLMRLIHRNPFCRDVAIWYDEFLKPGEDFSDAITNILRESDLFALAVTPNLVNESNYVAEVEYPAAITAGKPILAAELVPTDQDLLQQKFENIPMCTDPTNPTALADALLPLLSGIALQENNSNPTHNYFIGLAYLGGVDVEVDHERAVALITSAAEAQLPEAILKLVDMYQTGEGVTRDHRAAIDWQKKLVAICEAHYQAQPGPTTGETLAISLKTLGDYQMNVQDLNGAADSFRYSAAVCREQNTAPSLHIETLLALANLATTAEETETARKYLVEALQVNQAVLEDKANSQRLVYLDNILPIYYRICMLSIQQGQYPEAKTYALEGSSYIMEHIRGDRELRSILQANGPETTRIRANLAMNYQCLAICCQEEGDAEHAVQFLNNSIELLGFLVAANDQPMLRRNLSICYNTLGQVYAEQKQYNQAIASFQDAAAERQALIDQTDLDMFRLDLAFTQCELAKAFHAAGNAYGCLGACAESHALYQAVDHAALPLSHLRNWLDTCKEGAHLCSEAKDNEAAAFWYEQTATLCRRIYEQTQDDMDLYHLTLHSLVLVSLQNGLGDPRARDTLLSAKDYAFRLVQLSAADHNIDLLKLCANIFLHREEQEDAAECLALLQSLETRQAADTADAANQAEEATRLLMLAYQYQESGDLAAAEATARQALVIRQKLLAQNDQEANRKALAQVCMHLGDICMQREDLTGSHSFFKEAGLLYSDVAKANTTAEHLHLMATAYFQYAMTALEIDTETLEVCSQIWRQLSLENPDTPAYVECYRLTEQTLNDIMFQSKDWSFEDFDPTLGL